MSEGNIIIDVDKGTAKVQLATIVNTMKTEAVEILRDRAERMKSMWQDLSRIETGAHRESIRIEHVTQGPNMETFTVRAGGYIINPKTGRLVDYAWILEERYHAGRIAYEAVCADLPGILKHQVAEALNK